MGYESEGPAKASQTRDAWIRGGVEKPRGGVLTGKCHAQVGILQEEKGRSPAQKHGPGYARRLLVCLLKEIAQRELVDVIWYYCWWDYLGDQTKSEQSAKLNHLGGSQAKLESISPFQNAPKQHKQVQPLCWHENFSTAAILYYYQLRDLMTQVKVVAKGGRKPRPLNERNKPSKSLKGRLNDCNRLWWSSNFKKRSRKEVNLFQAFALFFSPPVTLTIG